jgi:hypothetical protein
MNYIADVRILCEPIRKAGVANIALQQRIGGVAEGAPYIPALLGRIIAVIEIIEVNYPMAQR